MNNYKNTDLSIFRLKKGLNITHIMKEGEKILISVKFFGKVSFLTGIILKFYQKSNSSPKSNLFSIFSRKYFTKNFIKL